MTDEVVGEYVSDIDDAHTIIHFDIPSKREYYENRLWCMRKHFHDPFNNEKVTLFLMKIILQFLTFDSCIITDERSG